VLDEVSVIIEPARLGGRQSRAGLPGLVSAARVGVEQIHNATFPLGGKSSTALVKPKYPN
jgi:hypothetical protein